MSILLTLADLFFIGSVSGWCLELVFRKFFSSANPKHKWINPGFCIGPYVPLYGFGLCILYLLASIGDLYGIAGSIWGKALLFLGMAVSMTLIEYIAGIMLLKGAKLRLGIIASCGVTLTASFVRCFLSFGLCSGACIILCCIHIFLALCRGWQTIWHFLSLSAFSSGSLL